MRCDVCGADTIAVTLDDLAETPAAVDMTPAPDGTHRIRQYVGRTVAYVPAEWLPDEPRYRLHEASCRGGVMWE